MMLCSLMSDVSVSMCLCRGKLQIVQRYVAISCRLVYTESIKYCDLDETGSWSNCVHKDRSCA